MSWTPEFDWYGADEGDVVVPEQAAIAVYLNGRGHIVVRQEGRYGHEEDMWIVIDPMHAQTVARTILEHAGGPVDQPKVPPLLAAPKKRSHGRRAPLLQGNT